MGTGNENGESKEIQLLRRFFRKNDIKDIISIVEKIAKYAYIVESGKIKLTGEGRNLPFMKQLLCYILAKYVAYHLSMDERLTKKYPENVFIKVSQPYVTFDELASFFKSQDKKVISARLSDLKKRGLLDLVETSDSKIRSYTITDIAEALKYLESDAK